MYLALDPIDSLTVINIFRIASSGVFSSKSCVGPPARRSRATLQASGISIDCVVEIGGLITSPPARSEKRHSGITRPVVPQKLSGFLDSDAAVLRGRAVCALSVNSGRAQHLAGRSCSGEWPACSAH